MGADDEVVIEWPGRVGRTIRPQTEADMRRTLVIVLLLYVFGIAASMPLLLRWVVVEGADTSRLGPAIGLTFAWVMWVAFVLRTSGERFVALVPPTALFGFVSAIVAINVALVSVGPRLGVVAVFLCETPVLAFFLLRPRWAVFWTVVMMVAYAVALSFVEDVAAPGEQWFVVLSSAVAFGVMMGGLAGRVDGTRARLDYLNRRLRRFLAPQVVDVLLTGEDALAPHRAEIAVMFVDLRGFTAFTNVSEPDEVVAVLDEYYAAVGAIVDRYNGTIGGFDGDGVFAFLGDPTPNENAAADALAMAQDIARVLDGLVAGWGDLGYGIGLAYGKATVGLVGFEGRIDYTPVGACVNLAARLCADAKHGEIVVDNSLRLIVGEVLPRAAIDLKGFGVTETYAVAH